ncbi:adenylate kinase/UMP-CMP kinase [Kipferlia bialata]|uniref:Adenylate kinase/UMP-CMP kinase n=1 Tax=Kipferlia bialata TaxID=797122 RepID=A0A9K3GKI2_9EUKA|nr:adenylate kinase/UMP-CMP kinase [Kipferlia bialata]|eukprot:g8009.t1
MTCALPRVIFVLGGPGAGKGTQSERLVKSCSFVHLSAGELLRAEMAREESEVGAMIRSDIKEGRIVKAEVTVGLLRDAIRRNPENETFLIDGFPRAVEQFECFEKIMHDTAVAAGFLYLDCEEQTLRDRLHHRSGYSGRTDDNQESIHKRIHVFKTSTIPVCSFMEGRGLLMRVIGDGSPDEVEQRILKHLAGHKLI